MSSEETPKRKSSLGWILCAAAMVVVFLLGMLAASINERKAEVASIYNNKKIGFFSFFGENWGCPGLPFPFTPCGFHRDPGGTEGSGNEHQDPPQL